jgi:hypothetical protein
VSGHLSALALDEAAAALPLPDSDRDHLATCPECQARLGALREANVRLLATPGAVRALEALLASVAPALGDGSPSRTAGPGQSALTGTPGQSALTAGPGQSALTGAPGQESLSAAPGRPVLVVAPGLGGAPASPAVATGHPATPGQRDSVPSRTASGRGARVALVAGGLALAAGLALWVTTSAKPADDTRLKGTPEVALLSRDGSPVTRASPGQSLDLALGGAGRRYAAVFALDAHGATSLLFPGTGAVMGPLRGGARELVAHLDVTPGDVLLLGFFADEPQPLEPLQAALRAAVAASPAPLDVKLPGATRLRLKVAATP